MAENGRILLICDDEKISSYLKEQLIFEGGCSVTFESTHEAGLLAFKQNNFDVVIAKLDPSDLDASVFVKNLKKEDPDSIVIAFVEHPTPDTPKDLFRLGVYDFITRPVNLEKLFFLIKKGMELHSLMVANRKLTQRLHEHNAVLQKQNSILSKRIEESTRNLTRLYEDLRSTYMRTIKVLAQAIDARDHYTHSHSENVAKFATAIAEELRLPVQEIELIREACELHDLGKIGVADNILGKPSSLTEEERREIKRHPIIGAEILEPLSFLNDVVALIRQHHEHYDGTGYPNGLKGEEILLGSRIINLADAYEAMRSARSYRKIPLTKEEAIAEIKKNSGAQFDPRVVEAFLKAIDKIEKL